MSTVSGVRELGRAAADPVVFAELLCREPLWKHQAALARSTARTRIVCAGRQVGKSRTLAVVALWECFRAPGRMVLVVSATELAARRLLAEVAGLAQAPILRGSVLDESKSELVLSNGSRILSVPASERQVRGWTADLLVVDEGAFVDPSVWGAARWVTIARDGRTLVASTPHGPRDGWFAIAYDAGRRRQEGFESFTWPSTLSPLVSREVLAEWRSTMSDRDYGAEILAEWQDDAGGYFTAKEIADATRDFVLAGSVEGPRWRSRLPLAIGVDWGYAHDSSALVGTGPVPVDHPLWAEGVRWCPLVVERSRMPYSDFVDLAVSTVASGDLWCDVMVSELNGVGAAPTQLLGSRFADVVERRRGLGPQVPHVDGVHTTSRLKEDLFGTGRLLLQQGRLLLPREPALLKQLEGLQFEVSETGSTRISVPERLGHDDLAMSWALSLKVAAAEEGARRFAQQGRYRWASGSGGR